MYYLFLRRFFVRLSEIAGMHLWCICGGLSIQQLDLGVFFCSHFLSALDGAPHPDFELRLACDGPRAPGLPSMEALALDALETDALETEAAAVEQPKAVRSSWFAGILGKRLSATSPPSKRSAGAPPPAPRQKGVHFERSHTAGEMAEMADAVLCVVLLLLKRVNVFFYT